MSSRFIIELREYSPMLWLVMSQRSVEWGFGTACIGILYIPGKSFSPKPFEKHPALIS